MDFHWQKDLLTINENGKTIVYTPEQILGFGIYDPEIELTRVYNSIPVERQFTFAEMIVDKRVRVYRKKTRDKYQKELRHYAFYQRVEVPEEYDYFIEDNGEWLVDSNLKKLSRQICKEQYRELKKQASNYSFPYSSQFLHLLTIYLFYEKDSGETEIREMISRI